jgi:O-glycosyl hydrolase
MATQNIQVNYLETRQTIEGFGCFAGREKDFFQDARREDIMKELFEQLQLSMLRTEVKPSFSTRPGERNFNMDANLDIPPNDPYFNSADQDEVKRRSQLWILKTACTYPSVKKIVPSVWSPPYYMKTSLKSLSSDYYAEFAHFLADYVAAYQTVGIPMFAMSPQNEPENIVSPWDVCLWLPSDTANFVEKHMKPTFSERGLNTKIMIGESANWAFNSLMLGLVSWFMNEKNVDILASHAYSLPNLQGETNYDTHPVGQALPSWHKSAWITEVASTTSFDPSMNMGLQAAICLHQFLTVKNVNAYMVWLGMIRSVSNEALICSDGVGTYQLTKAFDVLGNYSRYIKEAYQRIATDNAALDPHLYVSAFKAPHSDALSMVVINAGDTVLPLRIQLKQAPGSIATLTPYITPAELGQRWQAGTAIAPVDGAFSTSALPRSVTTFVGGMT